MIHHRLAHHPTLVDQWHLQLSTLLLFIVVDRKLNLDGPVGGKKGDFMYDSSEPCCFITQERIRTVDSLTNTRSTMADE